jgi:DNA-binding response OmpR family regulator
MAKTALLIEDDTVKSGIWAPLLRQVSLDVVSVGLQAKDLDSTENRAFDLIVLNTRDLVDAIALCPRLRSEFINPILLLAPDCDEEQVIKAYEAGVDDCLPTSISPRLFLAKVRARLRRSWSAGTSGLEDIRAGRLKLDSCRRELHVANRPSLKLTNLEFRVLHLLMSHPRRVLETGFIVDHVWGYAGHDESVLLKNVIYRLRRKIEPDPTRPRYIHTVNGAGYSFRPT